jgi:hypothetical protein
MRASSSLGSRSL